jgi:argininosuccinate lyase
MKVNAPQMLAAADEDFANATDMADYLVKKRLPFRQAHEVSGKSVRYCIEKGVKLTDLSLAELKQFSPLFEEDILAAIRVETCVAARNSYGGTSPSQVKEAIARGREALGGQVAQLDTYRKNSI